MELEVALKGDTVFRLPAPPPSPLPSPSSVAGQAATQQQARYLKSSYPIQPISAGASTAVYPSFDTIRGTSTTKRMSLFNVNGGSDKVPRVIEGTWGEEQEQPEQEGGLSVKDEARLEMWTKQCPSLRVIVLPGGVVWEAPCSSECVCFCDCTFKRSREPASEFSVPETSVAISPIRLIFLLPFDLLSVTVSIDEPPSAPVLAPPKPGTERFACPTIPSGSSYSSFELETPSYQHLSSESQILPTASITSLISASTSPTPPSTSASSQQDSPDPESEVDTWVERRWQQQWRLE
ncbi:hypothetical protein H1R20_g11267, partial [Candolleomyces eurysporus]